MDKIAGPVIAIAVMAFAVTGAYAFYLRNELADSKAALAAVAQNRDDFKTKLDDAGRRIGAGTLALDGCNTQLKDAQAQLEAAVKKTSTRR